MIRILKTSNRRALERLLSRDSDSDSRFDRRVAAIVDRVRTGGDAALKQFARRFDGVTGPLEISRDEMTALAAQTPAPVRRAIQQAVRHIRRVAARQVPKSWRVTVARGVSVEQRVEPLARVGCYVPGGRFPLPSSLLMTAVPAQIAGVGEIVVCCPRPEPAVMTAALAAGVSRFFRIGGAHAVAAMAFGTSTVPRVDKIVGPGNRYVAVAKAIVSRASAIDFFAGPTEIVIVAASGPPDWVAADLVAQAEHDPDARSVLITWKRGFASRVARATEARAAGREIATASLSRHGAILVARSASEAMALANRIAPEHLVVDRESLVRQSVTAGAVFVGPVHGAGRRRLRDGIESRAAHIRCCPIPRRLERGRFRPRHGRAAPDPKRTRNAGADDHLSGRSRRTSWTRRIDQSEAVTSYDYDKPAELYEGLRLHQNENTGGCSPRVLEALAALRPDQIAIYPPYKATVDACARHFGVSPDRVALTNGLDEGIFATAVVCLRPLATGPAEAIVPQPAFEIFALNASVAGGRPVEVAPRPDFEFALDEVLGAITPATRAVFLTNPNNPTGVSMPMSAIRTIAGRVPKGAVVFVDEAYADFAGATFIPELPDFPNVIVGRTFAKAHGLAGLRAGAIVGAPGTLAPIRQAIGVYSLNVAAAVALNAALADEEFVLDYLRQVRESKALVYAFCDRLGLKYWKSDANFVLVRTGGDPRAIAEATAARGIYLRDRGNEPGCEGCLRITAGIVEHTRRGLAVLEEVLCGAR